MSSQYILAKIELPILILPNGKYKIENEYTQIQFSKLDVLPPKQTQKQVVLKDLLSKLGGNMVSSRIQLDSPNLNGDDQLLVFKQSHNSNTNTNTTNNIEDQTVPNNEEDELKQIPPVQSITREEEPTLVLRVDTTYKPRKKNYHGTTFKTFHQRPAKYTRKLYENIN
jgi:hypothetical protein